MVTDRACVRFVTRAPVGRVEREGNVEAGVMQHCRDQLLGVESIGQRLHQGGLDRAHNGRCGGGPFRHVLVVFIARFVARYRRRSAQGARQRNVALVPCNVTRSVLNRLYSRVRGVMADRPRRRLVALPSESVTHCQRVRVRRDIITHTRVTVRYISTANVVERRGRLAVDCRDAVDNGQLAITRLSVRNGQRVVRQIMQRRRPRRMYAVLVRPSRHAMETSTIRLNIRHVQIHRQFQGRTRVIIRQSRSRDQRATRLVQLPYRERGRFFAIVLVFCRQQNVVENIIRRIISRSSVKVSIPCRVATFAQVRRRGVNSRLI